MKELQADKLELEIGQNLIRIPDAKGDLMDCKIIAPFEPVDEKSVHVVTDRGVFLISVDHCKIDGKDMADVEELKLKIPEKKQVNPK